MTQPGAVHVRRRRLLLACLLAGGALILVRGFQVQVLEASEWDRRADRQHQDRVVLPAARGTLFDRTGVPLAATREMVRVSVAPHEVREPERVVVRLREVLGVDAATARRALDRNRRWVVLPGRHDPAVRVSLDGLRGVYVERVLERYHPHGGIGLEVLGRIGVDGTPLGGLELELDSLLRGRDGFAVVRRDARGVPIPGALMTVSQPRAGHDVQLTLDVGLQEIAEQALRRALADHGAAGGDLIFADPRTGEVLAAASRRAGQLMHWPGVTDPYEPGSTIKPFIVAALMERGLTRLSDSVDTGDGRLRQGRRTISDVSARGRLTVGEVLRYSSNVGIVKLAGRMAPEEQYTALRGFGFGSPTGLRYPSESGGRLTRPDGWSAYTQASMAMGYEVSVTPLQMTMAYGALANGGRLLEPRLVQEVRSPEGRLVTRTGPRVVRRVVRAETAEAVADALADAVQEGTGRRAGLGEFQGRRVSSRGASTGRTRTRRPLPASSLPGTRSSCSWSSSTVAPSTAAPWRRQ
jgi:cell division protein FtsI (penicillin-binding protein 3)